MIECQARPSKLSLIFSCSSTNSSRPRNKAKASDRDVDQEDIHRLERKKKPVFFSKQCFDFLLGILPLLLVTLAMQLIAAQAMSFCQHEPLIYFYPPIWTVLALGNTFATFGCLVSQWYHLHDCDLPNFAIALGMSTNLLSRQYLCTYRKDRDAHSCNQCAYSLPELTPPNAR